MIPQLYQLEIFSELDLLPLNIMFTIETQFYSTGDREANTFYWNSENRIENLNLVCEFKTNSFDDRHIILFFIFINR